MIYVILGKSLSGKSYLQKQLIKCRLAQPLITTTTRPKRTPDETGYHFVSNKQYEIDKANGNALAPRDYKVANGDIWHYYLSRSELNKMQGNAFLILDLKGFIELRDALDIPITGVYLDVPVTQRLHRYLDTPRKQDDAHEFIRRLYDDEFNAFNQINETSGIIKVRDVTEALEVFKRDKK